jgi:cysteine synthase A
MALLQAKLMSDAVAAQQPPSEQESAPATRSAAATAPSASAPTTSRRIGSRTTASTSPCTSSTRSCANQFDNTANRQMHAATTAQEIFEQTGGRVDGFICAVGTGGTLGGVAYGLRERRPEVKIGLSDPTGSALYNHFVHGELKVEGSSISEGIGNSRITANLEGVDVDMAFRIPDSESVPLVFELMRREGLCLGSSSGVNVAGAIRMARELGPGHTIVTILCDSGLRYLRRLYNPQFLRSKDLPVPDWLDADPITGAGSAAPGDTTR